MTVANPVAVPRWQLNESVVGVIFEGGKKSSSKVPVSVEHSRRRDATQHKANAVSTGRLEGERLPHQAGIAEQALVGLVAEQMGRWPGAAALGRG